MKKKVLAIAIAAAIILAFAATALADPGVEPQITLQKVVTADGEDANIISWLVDEEYDDAEIADILDDISFKLYKSNAGGDEGDDTGLTGELDLNGNIKFPTGTAPGWYLIREVLSGKAAEIFKPAADVLVYFTGTAVVGSSDAFGYDDLYTIVNGYGYGYVLGYPGLNNTGDIFPIAVTNATTGIVYPSFCANAGSENFAGDNTLGCRGYLVANKIDTLADYTAFLSAYNYIRDVYGDLNKNRAITQIITWYLLDAIAIPSADFDAINWAVVEAGAGSIEGVSDAKAKVEDVAGNYSGYQGAGLIVDLVYMVCEIHDHDVKTCQPQLVPVYGGAPSFFNEPQPPQEQQYGGLKIFKVFSTQNDEGDYVDSPPVGFDPVQLKFTVTGPEFGTDGIIITYDDFDDDGVWERNNLIPGDYTVTETGGEVTGYHWGGAWYSQHPDDDYSIGSIEVVANQTVGITVNNDYSLGSLEISKVVAGALTQEDIIVLEHFFKFTVTSVDDPEFSASFELPYKEDKVVGDDADDADDATDDDDDEDVVWLWSKTLSNLKLGTYEVTEENAKVPSYFVDVSTYDYENDEYIPGNVVEREVEIETPGVEFTNFYRKLGSLTITKSVTGANVGDKTYSFLVTGPDEYSETVVLPFEGKWSYTIGELEPGEYTVSEDTGAARISPYSLSVRANGAARSTVTIDIAIPEEEIPEDAYNIVRFENIYSYEQREPEYGRLTVTKAFNVSYIPNSWSAVITVSGPGGYYQTRTITGSNRTVSFDGLEPGVYSVNEVAPGGVANMIFLSVAGEGDYDVTRGGTTQVTITNYYEEEEEDEEEPPEEQIFEDEVPLGDFPPDLEIEDPPPPLGDMPRTGIRDTSGIWMLAMCAAMLGVGAFIRVVKKTGKDHY